MTAWITIALTFLQNVVLGFFKQKDQATADATQAQKQDQATQQQQVADLKTQNAQLSESVKEGAQREETSAEVNSLDDADLFKRLRD